MDLLAVAFDLNGTAQTVLADILVTTLGYKNLQANSRLSIDFANAVQASSGLLVTISLFGA